MRLFEVQRFKCLEVCCLSGIWRMNPSSTNQQPPQRGGADPAWFGSKWLLAFHVTLGTPLTQNHFFVVLPLERPHNSSMQSL